MKKKLSIILIIILIFVMMTACGGQQSDESGREPGEPVKNTLNIATPVDASSLDPYVGFQYLDIVLKENIHSKLIEWIDAEYKPVLAESWQYSEDGLTWTFKLRQGVKFHNGEELKASDVVFTWNRAKESPMHATNVAKAEATVIDDYTVQFVLNQTSSQLLSTISTVHILNEKAVTEAGESYGENPVGTGAYKLASWTPGQKVVLERFEDYFNEPAPIKAVTYKVITDSNTALIALETGDVDICSYIPSISIQRVIDNPELNIYQAETRGLKLAVYNLETEPFTDVNFRKAINYAIDKDAMIQVVEEGIAVKAKGIWNKHTFGYSDKIKGYEHDVKKAKVLVEQSSYDGKEITISVGLIYQSAAELVLENLKDVGINAKIEVIEANTFFQKVMSGDYDLSIIDLGLIHDADQWSLVLHSDMIGVGYNMARFSNEEVDKLFEEAAVIVEDEQRLAKYERIAKILEEEAALVPIYFCVKSHVTHKDLVIEGVGVDDYKLENVRWK